MSIVSILFNFNLTEKLIFHMYCIPYTVQCTVRVHKHNVWLELTADSWHSYTEKVRIKRHSNANLTIDSHTVWNHVHCTVRYVKCCLVLFARFVCSSFFSMSSDVSHVQFECLNAHVYMRSTDVRVKVQKDFFFLP